MNVVEERHASRGGTVATPVYVYGIGRAGARAPAGAGVLGAAVSTVGHGAVAAFVSRLTSQRVRAKRRDLLAHSDVLQAAHARGVVLPLRFGMLFDSEDELRARLLEPRHDELLSLLERFDGLAEMRLRARYHDRDAVLADVVRDDAEIMRLRAGARSQSELVRLGELVARRYEGRRATDAEVVIGRLQPHALQVWSDAPDDELAVLNASFLVRDRDRKRFDDELDAVALRLRHLVEFKCTGPLPPHSFVALSDRGAA